MAKLKMAQFFGDKPNTGQYDNGVWQNIFDIPFLARITDAEKYDVIIRTLWVDATGWGKEIRNRYPHVIQIGLSDHPTGSHISKLPAARQYAYIADLWNLDGLMALTEEERQFYQVAAPPIPVIKSGLPFPFESYDKLYGHLKNRPAEEKKYIGLGVGASDNDRNFISSVLVFQRLRLDFPDLVGLFLSVPREMVPYVSYLANQYGGMYIQEREQMSNFYEMLSQCKFVINMADRNTPGRLQGEAAYFGVPVVGSNRLELQNELWPKLSVSPYALEDALAASRPLLEQPSGAERHLEIAYAGLQKYNYRQSKMRFNKLLREIESRR